jgi:hypothetical protein
MTATTKTRRLTYRRGDLVRYQGSTRAYHGVYEVVRPCSCAQCEEERATRKRFGVISGHRWVIRDAERVLACVSPASLARA